MHINVSLLNSVVCIPGRSTRPAKHPRVETLARPVRSTTSVPESEPQTPLHARIERSGGSPAAFLLFSPRGKRAIRQPSPSPLRPQSSQHSPVRDPHDTGDDSSGEDFGAQIAELKLTDSEPESHAQPHQQPSSQPQSRQQSSSRSHSRQQSSSRSQSPRAGPHSKTQARPARRSRKAASDVWDFFEEDKAQHKRHCIFCKYVYYHINCYYYIHSYS
jgi:hypothetical protein